MRTGAGVRGAADAGVHRCCAGGGLLSAIGAGRILGGNLDYNLIREGATVCCCRYFIRAVCCSLAMDMRCKGDGEAVGVETSLDVEVTVGLRKPRTQQAHDAPVPGPGRDLQLGIRLSL